MELCHTVAMRHSYIVKLRCIKSGHILLLFVTRFQSSPQVTKWYFVPRELHGSHCSISSYNQSESIIIADDDYYLLSIKEEEGIGIKMLLALPIKIGLINLSFVAEIFCADILVAEMNLDNYILLKE